MLGTEQTSKGLSNTQTNPNMTRDLDRLDKTTLAKLKDLEIQKKIAIDE